MKKRGRPPKPAEYWGDLGGLPLSGRQKKSVLNCGGRPTEFVVGINLLDACRKFFTKYAALQWRDRHTDKLVYEIADAKTLRSRVIEAQQRRREQEAKIEVTYTTSGKLNHCFSGELGELTVVAISDIQFTTSGSTTGLRSTRLVKVERFLHRK